MYLRPPDRPAAIRPIALLPLIILMGVIVAGCAPPDIVDNGGVSSSSASVVFSSSPVSFAPKLYFGSTTFNPNAQICDAVFGVTRANIDDDVTPAELVRTLFAGPTEEERVAGYTSFFSMETANAVRSVRVVNDTAYVNLTDIRDVIPNAGTSCGSAAFLAEITETLTQFPDVNRVILAIDGDPEPLYNWLQLGCSSENDNCDATNFREE